MPDTATAGQSGVEPRLWADYYEAVTRTLEIVRAGAITPAALSEVLAEHVKAGAVLERIRKIRGTER